MYKVLVSILLLMAIYSQDTTAHSEHDKARFVSNDGEDSGRCNNRARPCKSILYAAQHANKGDKILIGQGRYRVSNDQELFYLLSKTLPVLGGFSRIDLFRAQNPGQYPTFISGIPIEFAEQISEQGFAVIVDQKNPGDASYAMGKGIVEAQNQRQQNIACENGSADIYPCSNVSLLSHIPLGDFPSNPTTANDIWGHYDLNTQKEYALIGLRNAIAAVDVTNPEAPVVVGSIAGQSTIWRDIKVYQFYDHEMSMWRSYAYVTADGASDGLFIIDLTQLPEQFTLVQVDDTDRSAHNVYISNVDYSLNIANGNETPMVHLPGANNANGAFRSYSLADPQNLLLEVDRNGAGRTDYSHDLSSLSVSDERANTDCTSSIAGECRVMLDFNENALHIWDHTENDQITLLSATNYPNTSYTHSGWWSEDKQYVLVHDELDEQNFGLNTTINIFDISSLTQPQLVSTWSGPTRAIDHNGFVRGNRYYMSNYERGLTILDITDPAQPTEAGFFDTYPVADSASFNGAWGVYPFLPSGNILVSDINAGLFVLADNTSSQSPVTLRFEQASYTAEEGTSLTINVTKTGAGAASVGFETLPGAATDSDFVAQNGLLEWSDGDASARSITLSVLSDSDDAEVSENFFIRLFNPQNGASLITPSLAQIDIDGMADAGTISATISRARLREDQTGLEIEISRMGGTSGVATVDYQFQGGTATAGSDYVAAAGTLSWPQDDDTSRFVTLMLIDDDISERPENFNLQLSNVTNAVLGSISRVRLTIRDDDSNRAPSADAGRDFQANTRQRITLQGLARDPEGEVASVIWKQTGGSPVRLTKADKNQVSFTAPANAGSLQFTFTATDEFGITHSDAVNVDVIAASQAGNQSTGGAQ
ncbi:MAG: choice-of-anchor B domain-containing protein [Paraglaciecola sp.]|jgi:choice-of-anchor B domain-containing protein